MAVFSVTPNLGFDLINTTLASDIAAGNKPIPANLGEVVNGSDGKLYVLAKANGSIAASVAVCTVNAGTFLATNSGGAYTSPATAMVIGDYGWFGKANV
jgi:hypothetical protein